LKTLPTKTTSVDDVKLESFEGLGIIPIDILQQGTKMITKVLPKIFNSHGNLDLSFTGLTDGATDFLSEFIESHPKLSQIK